MDTENKPRITATITVVQNGQTQRTVARIYGVSQATLPRRLKGGIRCQRAMVNKQLLSPGLETYLVDMVLDLELAERTSNCWQSKQMTECILKAQGIDKRLEIAGLGGF
ncbi:hypothetical protein HD806DRAFT_159875 [Xylariaceae sp. AK1471]|nr:hypothetical protein HD806DRAFT_159875 [Xylariaceae sp. AK1471]